MDLGQFFNHSLNEAYLGTVLATYWVRWHIPTGQWLLSRMSRWKWVN